MGTAILKFKTEGGSDARRVIEDLAAAYVEAQKRVGRAARESGEAVARSARASGRRVIQESAEAAGRQVGAYRGARVQIEREEQLVTRAKLRELALQGAAQKTFLERYTAALKLATAAMEAEVGKRGQLSDRERRQVESVALAMVAAHEQAETAKTRKTEQEERRRRAVRDREQRQTSARASRALGAAGSAVMGAGAAIHGEVQGARERRAASEHTLNGALFQAGVSGAEAASMRALLTRETQAGGSLYGMRSEDVAGALAGAQTQFSVLSGPDQGARGANLQRQVELMAYARNTYQDPSEVLRVSGMLGQQGIRGGDQMATIQTLTGLAAAGSIELSTLSSTALGPLMQNIARSVTSGMSPAERAAAVRRTTVETMAVGEIGAAAGLSSRDSLSALAKMRASVVNPRMAENLYGRLHGMGRDDLANSMLQRGADGRHTLRNADPIALMSGLVTGFGGDANAVSNVLSSGGPGAPMILDSQQRRLITAMASQTSGGQTVAQRVDAMKRAGEGFGQADVTRGASMRDAEQLTALVGAQETHDASLTDNTSAINNLSNSLRDFQTRNPITSAAASAGVGVAGSAVGGALASRAGGAVGSVAAAGAARVAAMGGVAAAGTTAAAVTGSLVAGLAIGEGINRLIYNDRDRAQGDTSILDGETWRNFGTALSQTFTDALQRNPPQVVITPNDLVHHGTTVTSGRQAGS